MENHVFHAENHHQMDEHPQIAVREAINLAELRPFTPEHVFHAENQHQEIGMGQTL